MTDNQHNGQNERKRITKHKILAFIDAKQKNSEFLAEVKLMIIIKNL